MLTPSGTLKSALLIGKKNPVQLGGCMLVVVLKCLCTTWTCPVLVCAMKPKHICNCVSCQLCTDQRSFSLTCLEESSHQRLIYFKFDNPSKWSTTSSAVFKPFGESPVKVHVRHVRFTKDFTLHLRLNSKVREVCLILNSLPKNNRERINLETLLVTHHVCNST